METIRASRAGTAAPIPIGRLIPLPALIAQHRARELAPMTLGTAKLIAGTLGHPSKMPGYSYGLHATRCRTGSKMAKVPGSICAGCFALKGFYATWRPALVARDRRHRGIMHPLWIDAMVRMIAHYCRPPHEHFRWHDSGDLQGPWHLAAIVEVCRRTPGVTHWLPTREYADVAAYIAGARARAWTRTEQLAAGGGTITIEEGDVSSGYAEAMRAFGVDVDRPLADVFPRNLCVRLSALMIDSEPVIPAELAHLPTSTVHTPGAGQILEGKGAIECRASYHDEYVCGKCRACWDPRVRNVSYPEH